MGELRRLVEEISGSYPQGFGQTRVPVDIWAEEAVNCKSRKTSPLLLLIEISLFQHLPVYLKSICFSDVKEAWFLRVLPDNEVAAETNLWHMRWPHSIVLILQLTSLHMKKRKEGKSLCSSSAGPICHTVPTALNRFATAAHRAPYFYRRLKKCRVFFIICSLSAFSFQLVRMKSSLIWIFLPPVTGCSSSLGGGSTPLEIIYSQTGFIHICSQWQHSGDMLATLITNEHQPFSVGRVPCSATITPSSCWCCLLMALLKDV